MMALLPTAQLPAAQLIAQIERHALDTQLLPPQPIFGQIDSLVWLHVLGLAHFWDSQQHGVIARCVEDTLVGLHGGAATTALLLHAVDGQLRLYLGMHPERSGVLEPVLRGTFPGIALAPALQRLGSALKQQGMFGFSGQLMGIPTLKAAAPDPQRNGSGGAGAQPPVQQIERVIRGMGRASWGFYVHAMPVDPSEVLCWSAQALELIKLYDEQARMTRQIRDGLNIQGDRQAQQCVALLERQLERLDRGKSQGMWRAESSFFAAEPHALAQLAGLLRATYAGAESRPEPLRARPHSATVAPVPIDLIQTVLHTGELATLMQLPSEEAPGYHVRDYARFDLALPAGASSGDDMIAIGAVLDGDLPTGQKFSVARDDLAKHGLIVGVTGSGKTNTCFGLLERIWQGGRGQPFLVIEPAKAEYRSLLHVMPGQMRVYTLGDERYAPFRLNPFEFECQDAEARIHVQTHIDYLKSVFNAAFVLYAPMPYVLETCLHEVYQDRGWNLTTSAIERRLPPDKRGHEAEYPVFPTLQDLYTKIDGVVDRLGYDDRIQQDVKAGLKARIGSLLLGGKGLMLNTRRSLPIGELLRRPIILELERVGDDDEKAFLMGLLLTRLYEHRVVEGRKQAHSDERLRHVLLIEEAHRLLQNISTSQDTESANPRGKAVESFANMLAEIRAYGQGVLIAEQIPTKLTPDAIKNTNLKILHRTVAADERAVMAGAMNLDQAQTRAITALGTGQAAIYAEGADRPYLVKIDQAKGAGGRATAKPADAQLRLALISGNIFDDEIYKPRPGCERCGLWKSNPARCATIRDVALTAQANPGFAEVSRRYTLSLAEQPARAVHGYPDLLQQLKQLGRPGDEQELRDMALCALIHRSAEQVEQQGQHYSIPYDALANMHAALLAVLTPVVKNFQNDQAALTTLHQHVEPKARDYGQLMRKLTEQSTGPFAGCIFCDSRCRYGFDLAPLAADTMLRRDVVDAIERIQDDTQMWARLADISRAAAARAITVSDPRLTLASALCFACQAGAALKFSGESQRKLAKHTRDTLAATKGS
jgi:Helicase HerA, central domain